MHWLVNLVGFDIHAQKLHKMVTFLTDRWQAAKDSLQPDLPVFKIVDMCGLNIITVSSQTLNVISVYTRSKPDLCVIAQGQKSGRFKVLKSIVLGLRTGTESGLSGPVSSSLK